MWQQWAGRIAEWWRRPIGLGQIAASCWDEQSSEQKRYVEQAGWSRESFAAIVRHGGCPEAASAQVVYAFGSNCGTIVTRLHENADLWLAFVVRGKLALTSRGVIVDSLESRALRVIESRSFGLMNAAELIADELQLSPEKRKEYLWHMAGGVQ